MLQGYFISGLHVLVGLLLYPVIAALFVAVALTVWETGLALAERFYSLKHYRNIPEQAFTHYAVKRLERSDLLTRSGPILGLMGTLIPLGPGLTALGNGNLDILATALTVAFDTTVLGLLVGLAAYIISRVRRRWYDQTWRYITEFEGNTFNAEKNSSHEAQNNAQAA